MIGYSLLIFSCGTVRSSRIVCVLNTFDMPFVVIIRGLSLFGWLMVTFLNPIKTVPELPIEIGKLLDFILKPGAFRASFVTGFPISIVPLWRIYSVVVCLAPIDVG